MKFYVFSFILESAVVRSEMEVVLRCKDYIQVDSLTVVDFTMLLICGHAHAHAHALVVIYIVSRFIVGYLFLITLFSLLYTLCRIVNKLITNNETRDDNNKRRVTPTVK